MAPRVSHLLACNEVNYAFFEHRKARACFGAEPGVSLIDGAGRIAAKFSLALSALTGVSGQCPG
jgi:hypothetical protein